MTHTPTELVDRLAEVRAEMKRLSDEESDIRATLLALEQNIIEGERNTAIVKLVVSNRFDTAATKKEMGAAWYDAHTVPSKSIRIETVAKAA